jgi:ankyrin repeat protein
MKTQNTNSLKVFAKITFFAALLIIVSCKGKEDSVQEEPSAVSKSDVKPPQIDIHTAVLTGNIEALKQHIAAGTNLNEKDPFGGSSPLITASLFGKSAEARVLIEAGADLNFQNNDGATPLHTAAFFCRPEIVQMLLDKGADKTIKNKFGATAYESVAGPFGEIKNTYDIMGKVLGPMGLKLDYPYIEKTRPEIAAMLK